MPDGLDGLLHHIRTTYLNVNNDGQYRPPRNHIGDLQHPVAIEQPTAAQLESSIAAARWTGRLAFPGTMAKRRRKAKKKEGCP